MSKLLDDKEIGLVKRFFDFDLSEKELDQFQDRLEKDNAFAKEVDNYETAYNTVDQFIIGNKGGDIPIAEIKKTAPTKVKPRKRNPMQWAIAAVLILVLVFGGYYMISGTSNEIDERVFAQADNYTKMMSDDILRGNTNPSVSISTEEQELKDIVSNYTKDNTATTVTSLQTYINSIENPVNKELAEWWLANVYLQNKDIDNARITLEKIKDNPNYNSGKKAATFLEQL